MSKLNSVFVSAVLTALSVYSLPAANLDVDNASASAYAGGWNSSFPAWSLDGTVGQGGGFGGWNLSANPNANLRIESVSSLGGGTLLDTAGKSFRLSGGFYSPNNDTNFEGAYANAVRYLDPNGLSAGQSFSFQMAVNWRNGAKGVHLDDTAGVKVFNFNIGGDNYVGRDLDGYSFGRGY